MTHLRPVPRKTSIKRTLFGVVFIIGLLAGLLLYILELINFGIVVLIIDAAIGIIGLLSIYFFDIRRRK